MKLTDKKKLGLLNNVSKYSKVERDKVKEQGIEKFKVILIQGFPVFCKDIRSASDASEDDYEVQYGVDDDEDRYSLRDEEGLLINDPSYEGDWDGIRDDM